MRPATLEGGDNTVEEATCEAVVQLLDRTVVVRFDTNQLRARRQGDLVTAEIASVAWLTVGEDSLRKA